MNRRMRCFGRAPPGFASCGGRHKRCRAGGTAIWRGAAGKPGFCRCKGRARFQSPPGDLTAAFGI